MHKGSWKKSVLTATLSGSILEFLIPIKFRLHWVKKNNSVNFSFPQCVSSERALRRAHQPGS